MSELQLAHASPSLLLDPNLTEESRERLVGELPLIVQAAEEKDSDLSNIESFTEATLKVPAPFDETNIS